MATEHACAFSEKKDPIRLESRQRRFAHEQQLADRSKLIMRMPTRTGCGYVGKSQRGAGRPNRYEGRVLLGARHAERADSQRDPGALKGGAKKKPLTVERLIGSLNGSPDARDALIILFSAIRSGRAASGASAITLPNGDTIKLVVDE